MKCYNNKADPKTGVSEIGPWKLNNNEKVQSLDLSRKNYELVNSKEAYTSAKEIYTQKSVFKKAKR